MTGTEESKVNSPVVRAMQPEDSAAVAALSRQLGYEMSAGDTCAQIEQIGAHPESQIALVACVEGEVAGWIEAAIVHHLQSEPFVLIGGLVVREGVRGHGVGKRLCAEVEGWGRRKGLRTLRVTSRSTRTDAHRFYAKEGFTRTKMSVVFEKALS